MPDLTTYVGRGTRWGNPFNDTQVAVAFSHWGFPIPLVHLGVEPSRERCIDMYIAWLAGRLQDDPGFLEPLRGRNLACWCDLRARCHADVLLRLANR